MLENQFLIKISYYLGDRIAQTSFMKYMYLEKKFKRDIKSLFFRTTHAYHFMQVKSNKTLKSI